MPRKCVKVLAERLHNKNGREEGEKIGYVQLFLVSWYTAALLSKTSRIEAVKDEHPLGHLMSWLHICSLVLPFRVSSYLSC